ncbi:hypothetical protein HHI36_014787 [Cryptolaemus montrouzieri]|uniref:Uncharacterized protein n=1 Tax=Cryptolaemus montrouzieri TaxID=559131 RepID=A0ABD2N408_9CUCU
MTKTLEKQFQQIPTLTENNEKHITAAKKANKLATNFEEIHTLQNIKMAEQKQITKGVDEFQSAGDSEFPQEFLKALTTPVEVSRVIKALPNNETQVSMK